MSRLVRVLGWGALIVVGLASAGPASASEQAEAGCTQERFALQELSPAGGSVVRDMNAEGWVAGQIAGGGPPIVWEPDGDAFAPPLDPVVEGDHQVEAINARGDIVGDGSAQNGWSRVSWMYTLAGKTKVLRPVHRRMHALPYDINQDRVIVGQGEGRPVIWRHPTQRAKFLPMPKWATFGAARGVGPRGAAQGVLRDDSNNEYYARWSPRGKLRSVEKPPTGFGLGLWFNDFSGRYVSGEVDFGEISKPAIWGPDGLVLLGSPDQVIWGQASAVTRSGHSAGSIQFNDLRQEAFIASPTGQVTVFEDFSWATAVVDADGFTAVLSGQDETGAAERQTCLASQLP